MSLLIGVGGGQIVVFARVDDNASKAVDYAREILVNQCALHIDVAEQNTVEGIVKHHIEPLKGAHSGNLWHTKA